MPHNKRPRLFIGSSAEAKEIAEALRENLADDADIVVWTEAFPPGKSFLDALTNQVENSDFAVLLMTPDDITESRGRERVSPRDNVILELGLFIGKIGTERCYCVHPEPEELKFPSDLLGITTVRYRPGHPNGLPSALGAACNKIRRTMKDLGLRGTDNPAAFCSRITGFWWEYIKPVNVSSLGFLEMIPDGSGGIQIKGEAHREDGSRAADWWTEGCALNPHERKLLYVWKGRYLHAPDRPFEGFGDFSFNDSDGKFFRGHGYFAEMDATDLRKTRKRAGTIARASEAEVETMHSGNSDQIGALVQKKLALG
jgi:hypothetical protein